MKVHIHRGQNQIGGSIIEVSSEQTRLMFDIGINLNECETVSVPKIDGVFAGKRNCDAVFISHYHADHMGLVSYLLPGIPIYMGEKAFQMYRASAEYRNLKTAIEPLFIRDGQKIQIGDITVTPLCCDHSAYDSYMFVIENRERKILYTGDFRANGRMNFSGLMERIPKADVLITEGTTLSRKQNRKNIEEEQLEDIAVNFLKGYSGPAFMMMSAMNIDRLITAYHVAQRTGRILMEDVYTANIASQAGPGVPVPDRTKGVRVFSTGGDKQYAYLQKYGNHKIGKAGIAKLPFLMTIRQSMEHYLDKLSEIVPFENGVLFYGMWKGYLEQPELHNFIEHMKGKGVRVHILHTSGHADEATLDELICHVSPEILIPVHTENEKWFERYEEAYYVVIEKNEIIV